MFSFRQKKAESYPQGDHAPATFETGCLGEKCPNYGGRSCDNSFYEWIGAKATVTAGRDLSVPPLLSEVVYVTYGQVCGNNASSRGVRYRIHDYGEEKFSLTETGLIIHGDSHFGNNIDVDLVDLKIGDDGLVTEKLRETFYGWGK